MCIICVLYRKGGGRRPCRGSSECLPAQTEGATLTDVDGNVFLDFASGIGILKATANDPTVVATVREQIERFMHTCFQVTMSSRTSASRRS